MDRNSPVAARHGNRPNLRPREHVSLPRGGYKSPTLYMNVNRKMVFVCSYGSRIEGPCNRGGGYVSGTVGFGIHNETGQCRDCNCDLSSDLVLSDLAFRCNRFSAPRSDTVQASRSGRTGSDLPVSMRISVNQLVHMLPTQYCPETRSNRLLGLYAEAA